MEISFIRALCHLANSSFDADLLLPYQELSMETIYVNQNTRYRRKCRSKDAKLKTRSLFPFSWLLYGWYIRVTLWLFHVSICISCMLADLIHSATRSSSAQHMERSQPSLLTLRSLLMTKSNASEPWHAYRRLRLTICTWTRRSHRMQSKSTLLQTWSVH